MDKWSPNRQIFRYFYFDALNRQLIGLSHEGLQGLYPGEC
jgi:hypothetical protein